MLTLASPFSLSMTKYLGFLQIISSLSTEQVVLWKSFMFNFLSLRFCPLLSYEFFSYFKSAEVRLRLRSVTRPTRKRTFIFLMPRLSLIS